MPLKCCNMSVKYRWKSLKCRWNVSEVSVKCRWNVSEVPVKCRWRIDDMWVQCRWNADNVLSPKTWVKEARHEFNLLLMALSRRVTYVRIPIGILHSIVIPFCFYINQLRKRAKLNKGCDFTPDIFSWTINNSFYLVLFFWIPGLLTYFSALNVNMNFYCAKRFSIAV